jgi:hypothetical protein
LHGWFKLARPKLENNVHQHCYDRIFEKAKGLEKMTPSALAGKWYLLVAV